MRAVEGLHPPVPYATHWAVLGVVLLLLAAAAVTVVLRVTRRPRVAPAPTAVAASVVAPVLAPAVALEEVRRRARAELREAAARHGAGDLDDRGLALAVSAAVRRVAEAASGLPVSAMALDDLAGSGVPQLAGPVAAVVRACYPPAFAGGGRSGVADAGALLGAAREAVDAWG